VRHETLHVLGRIGRRRAGLAAAIVLACLWTMPLSARAVQAEPVAADPVLEEQVNRLAAELRCLVCQNQSLADSHADLAVDLKNQVREQLRAGRSAQQVVDYMTERYGDFVLYRPPVKPTTWLLWAGPLLLLLAGAAMLWRTLVARTAAQDTPPPAADLQHAALLLGTPPEPPPSADPQGGGGS
jgi:cytochrome c-type biogenesis protein CcmH